MPMPNYLNKKRTTSFLFIGIIILIFAPQFLSNMASASYWQAIKLTTASLFLAITGLLFILLCKKTTTPLAYPFHFVLIGQLLLVTYIYLRSFLNQHLFLLPINSIDFLVLVFAITFVIQKTSLKKLVYEYARNNWQSWLLIFAIYFLLLIALSEHELPRLIMLSSDPDQHAFFGRQIQRFGTIPFHQFEWGPESFKYPAGTGALSFLWATLSASDIRDSLTIQPILQAYIAIFIIAELTLSTRKHSLNAIGFMLLSFALIYQYCLPYSLDQAHYHLEGTGRLMSLSIFSLLFSLFIQALNKSNVITGSLAGTLSLFIILLFNAMILNPINAVNTGLMLAITFLILYKNHLTYYPYLLLLGLAIPLALLDPYYLEMITDGKTASNVQSTHSPISYIINYNEILTRYTEKFSKKFFLEANYFTQSYLLPTKLTYWYLILATLLAILITGLKSSLPLLRSAFIFITGLYLIWSIITSFFQVVGVLPQYRLLLPYYRDNNYQLLYIFYFWLVSIVISNISSLNFKKKIISASLLYLLIMVSALYQAHHNNINIQPRVDYCGVLGCITKNDLVIIKKIEYEYANFKQSPLNNSVTPKILLPNILRLQNNEKWLFPTGASRALPFYDTFPLAFFYFQGSSIYTFDNYKAFVCDSFNLDKLKLQHIQYLFIPEYLGESCIFSLPQIIQQSEVLARSRNSYFIKLY